MPLLERLTIIHNNYTLKNKYCQEFDNKKRKEKMNTQINTLNEQIRQRRTKKYALEMLGLTKSTTGVIVNAN